MPSYDSYRELLERTLEHAVTHFEELDSLPVGASVSKGDIRARLDRGLNDDGIDPKQVIDDLVADCADSLTYMGNARFFAWVIGGAVPAALAADWMTSVWDQNSGLHAGTPAGAMTEEIAGEWLKELLGIPRQASFAFVTGCLMAHVTCLAAARNGQLAKIGWDVEAKGLSGTPAIKILTGEERHQSLDSAARLVGIGEDNIVALPVNEKSQLRSDALRDALSEYEEHPIIVSLQAGELNTGAYDEFAELIPIAHEHGAWAHIDGAFGLWANVSDKLRHLLNGADRADSWATDGHKWLNVPYDCGYAFVAHPEPHRAATSLRASYLIHDAEVRDQFDWTPEWSRRARGFATYAAIRQLGRKGITEIVERDCRCCSELVRRLGDLDHVEIVAEPIINQGLVRFLDPREGATEEDHERFTDETIAAISKTGVAYFGGVNWRDKRCMRISVTNWQTDEDDVELTVAAVKGVLEAPPANP